MAAKVTSGAPPVQTNEAHTRAHAAQDLSQIGMMPSELHAAQESIKELEKELRAAIAGEVRFDAGTRAMYSTDGSNYRQVPIGVVLPKSAEDVVETVAACRRHSVPVLPRGGGTSLAGQCCNVAVVVDFSKYMNNVLRVDPDLKQARVEPGTILDSLRKAADRYQLTFAPDPATHTHNCLGGMIGNNSCGIHSVMGGKTVDNIEELDILTYDGLRMRVGATSDEELESIIAMGGRRGEIYAGLKSIRDEYAGLIRERYPKIPRRVSGYNLDQLLPENGFNVAKALVGSEGTCVTVLEATCRLMHNPPHRSLLVLGYEDVFSAGDHVPEVMRSGPIALEGIDDRLISDMKKKGLHPEDVQLLPGGNGWLLVEFGAESKDESDAKARELMQKLKHSKDTPTMKLFDDPEQEKMVWQIRESGLGATALVPGAEMTWPGWEDSAVPPDRVGDYLRDLRKLLEKHGYMCDLYGHFGQGCIHTRIDFDLCSKKGLDTYRQFMDEATDLVLGYGGSLSGEHGDGQSRAMFLPKMYGAELMEAFRKFKKIWDPDWRMNPGKVIDPYGIGQNLRLGPDYNPRQPDTYFKYPEDKGKFSRATLRCVGVGDCRRLDGGVMCPSFMASREEKNTTRGRARLLFEMLQGDPIRDGWNDQYIRQSLDLCLACKGCKGDCPVNVDIATYKAEFLAHHYEGKMRPLHMYAFGFIFKWAPLAALFPGLSNLFTRARLSGGLLKRILNIAPERKMPQFAPQSFQKWFSQRQVKNEGKTQVLLWPDTFNNYFFPETAKAAVDVLEGLGFQVIVPEKHVCCGRPLYDYGLLDAAAKQLQATLDALRPFIRQEVPIVGLEPSCISVFRDELTNLMPDDEDAHHLSKQSWLLSEFVERYAKDSELPQLPRKAIVHGHCHHKSIMKMKDEASVLERMGVEAQHLESSCCGMAGAFGYVKDHLEISLACGEQALLPAVRAAAKSDIIIADGFSCREQIQQTTDRHGLHLAEVMQMAMNGREPSEDYPEAPFVEPQKQELDRMRKRSGLIIGAGAAVTAGLILYALLGKKHSD